MTSFEPSLQLSTLLAYTISGGAALDIIRRVSWAISSSPISKVLRLHQFNVISLCVVGNVG